MSEIVDNKDSDLTPDSIISELEYLHRQVGILTSILMLSDKNDDLRKEMIGFCKKLEKNISAQFWILKTHLKSYFFMEPHDDIGFLNNEDKEILDNV